MNKDDLKWIGALTFEEWVLKMILEKKTKDPEFLAAQEFFGRDRFVEIWLKHKEKTKKS